jgi:phage baseplate assembly protein W
MIKKLYNNTVVASAKATVLNAGTSAFTYKGFSSSNNATAYKLFDIDLVKQDLMNHFYIRKGEKLQNPDFGTVIWDMLFEPFTPEVKDIIAKDVQDIINYDPRIQVNTIYVDTTDIGIQITADITYLPFNITDQMTLNFDKKNSVIN